ncbi:hypothetical protein I7I48_05505 [Histoplasma ohiense]|nr:hypothetical protein I7I48_05505 [Histoplasma ohiense (nom. inval.)]
MCFVPDWLDWRLRRTPIAGYVSCSGMLGDSDKMINKGLWKLSSKPVRMSSNNVCKGMDAELERKDDDSRIIHRRAESIKRK